MLRREYLKKYAISVLFVRSIMEMVLLEESIRFVTLNVVNDFIFSIFRNKAHFTHRFPIPLRVLHFHTFASSVKGLTFDILKIWFFIIKIYYRIFFLFFCYMRKAECLLEYIATCVWIIHRQLLNSIVQSNVVIADFLNIFRLATPYGQTLELKTLFNRQKMKVCSGLLKRFFFSPLTLPSKHSLAASDIF